MLRKRARPVRREAARKRTSPGWHLAARSTLLEEMSESAPDEQPPKRR
jgi:hypothetical protein